MVIDFATEIANIIIGQLQKGTAPWQKPWEPGEYRSEAHNPISDNRYRGINSLVLEMKNHDDPRWMTYRQAAARGYQVRKGEKATTIEYWQWTKAVKALDENGKVITDAEGREKVVKVQLTRPRVFYAKVFNGEQIDRLEKWIPPKAPEAGFAPDLEAERILGSLNVPIRHDQGDRAFYRSISDEIHLPPKSQFKSKELYYATALHELGHATGHSSRLNRDLSGGFGSQKYAREELRAEIASYMLNTRLGLGHDPGQHASYVESWIRILKDDPREIFRAARDADVIQNYVTLPELRQTLESPAGTRVEQKAGKETEMVRRTYIQVPYEERGEAKTAGGRWDGKVKSWYIPDGVDKAGFTRWPEGIPGKKDRLSPEAAFGQFLREQGVKLDGDPVMDGQRHRVAIEGDQNRKMSGSYRGFSDGRVNGEFVNFKVSETPVKWVYTGQELTGSDRAAITKQREASEKVNAGIKQVAQDKAAKSVFGLYAHSEWAKPDHPYLEAKGVNSFGVKVTRDNKLLIPMRDMEGHLHSAQFISPDGDKRYLTGAAKKGHFHLVGNFREMHSGNADQIIIAEGYATAATLHQNTGLPVVVAFDGNNLKPVAEAIRSAHPGAGIIIAADHDHALKVNGKLVNVGLEKATEAAKAVKGVIIMPSFREDEKTAGLTDWNDLAGSRGAEVGKTIKAAIHRVSKSKDTEMAA